MGITRKTSVCLVPRLSGIGGMVSFQHKLASGLAARGIEVSYDLEALNNGSVLVVGGTRQIHGLWRARRRGIRIVQRLDGINWMHRIRPTGLRHYLRAEYGNYLLAFIRARLTDGIVYQSHFAKKWWNEAFKPVAITNRVVYNGVDLQEYTPVSAFASPINRVRLLIVEGRLAGGYESGLENAVSLAYAVKELLASTPETCDIETVELTVVGRVDGQLKSKWKQSEGVVINWVGQVDRERIPEIDRSAHLLFSADINAACPNSVIEALACGTPVVAFNTGALPELVSEWAGKIVPYGGDPWRLDPPDISSLAMAAISVIAEQDKFRHGARLRAESAFSLDHMVDGYYEALSS